ncbi:MAG: hypothetical protein IJ518_05335 [Clostridia bacterium]|nr:hypothetical protein [Clostridia bacterium]
MTRPFRFICLLSAAVAVVFFLLAILGLWWFDWNNHKKPTFIDKAVSPDGRYTLQLEQIGAPAFFDSADARISLYAAGSTVPIEILHISVSNDGAGLFRENWQVSWDTDRVTILVKGWEEPEKCYEMPLG